MLLIFIRCYWYSSLIYWCLTPTLAISQLYGGVILVFSIITISYILFWHTWLNSYILTVILVHHENVRKQQTPYLKITFKNIYNKS